MVKEYDQFILLLAFFIIFIPHYLKGLPYSMNALIDSEVVRINPDEAEEVELYADRLFGHWMITIIPFLVSSLFVILDVIRFLSNVLWPLELILIQYD